MRSRETGFHSPLAAGIEQFIAHKRAIARRFDTEESALRLFDRYLLEQGVQDIGAITPALLETFLNSRPRNRPRSYNHLLGVLRRLFDWLVAQGHLTSSPLHVHCRRTTANRLPYLLSIEQAHSLLEMATNLADNPKAANRGQTYRTIFAILHGLGLRVGEVSRLCIDDVNLERNFLIIRHTKFSKSRLVPFGPKISALLQKFIELRRSGHEPLLGNAPVFSFGLAGRPIHKGTISHVFHKLALRLDLRVPEGASFPRVHDLRHGFAVGTLLRWYREGINPSDRLLQLSTFLGHVDPASTAVYLTITSELLEQANGRFEQFASPLLEVSHG